MLFKDALEVSCCSDWQQNIRCEFSECWQVTLTVTSSFKSKRFRIFYELQLRSEVVQTFVVQNCLRENILL